jgi:hypothetical protein
MEQGLGRSCAGRVRRRLETITVYVRRWQARPATVDGSGHLYLATEDLWMAVS